jgi:hypothetical protein
LLSQDAARLTAPDRDILQWVAAHRGPWWTGSAKALMDLGRSVVLLGLALVAVLVLAVALHALRAVVAAGGAAVLAAAASVVLKAFIARPRPGPGLALVRVGGYSMPSTTPSSASPTCTTSP